MCQRRWGLRLLVAVCAAWASGCDGDGGPAGGDGAAQEASTEFLFGPGQLLEDGDWAMSAVVVAPADATRIGMLVDLLGPEDRAAVAASVQVRGFDADGAPLGWVRPEVTWQEDRYLVARADTEVGLAAAQLRVPASLVGAIAYVTFAAMVPASDPAKADAAGLATEAMALSAAGHFQPRAAWQARATKCSSTDGKKSRMAIHHTFTPPNSGGSFEARLRSIQAYHMDTRGWCDIGYHFLVTDDGSVWEGRPLKYIGAHVSNHNTGNVGISFVGCFQSGECDALGSMTPSAASLTGAAKMVRALSDEYGIAITTANVKGHLQHSGASTTCPGDKLLSRLSDILAAAKAGSAVGGQPPAPGPGPVQSTGRVQGVVWDSAVTASPTASGVQLITNAAVSVSGGSASAVDPSSAYWSFDLPAGTYSFLATAPGYEATARSIEVISGQSVWASIGLAPGASPEPPSPVGDVSTVRVVAAGGGALADSVVYVEGLGSALTDAAGARRFELDAPAATVRAFAVGYAARVAQVARGATAVVALSPEAPGAATVQGVVWDASVTVAPTDASAVALAGAIVVSSAGTARRARAGDAYWSFSLPPGAHTLTAIADGYEPASREATATTSAGSWASIGLLPLGTSAPAPGGGPSPGEATACYPGPSKAWDVCIPLVAASTVSDPSYVYPTGGPSAQYAAPTHFIDLQAVDPATKVAPNFALSELMQADKGRWGLFTPSAVAHLQAIRSALGVPLTVNSGFRSPGYNAAVDDSATFSRHMYGDGADLATSGGVSLTTLKNTCTAKGADYVQVYTSHVHCDWRNDALNPGFWGGAFATGSQGAAAWLPDPSRVPAAAWVQRPSWDPAPGDAVVLRAKHRGFDEGVPWVRWTVRGPRTALVVEPASELVFEATEPGAYYVTYEVGQQVAGELVVDVR
jgi:hypothetical protein